MQSSSCQWLALGDSYTVAEGLSFWESYPAQSVLQLRRQGRPFTAPEILARTGWTSGELLAAAEQHCFLPVYDWVSLLIGVNDQYRGLPLPAYKSNLNKLMEMAFKCGGERASRLLVISIPDWGHTPFALGRDMAAISGAIDDFNAVNRELALSNGFHYLDITESSRQRPLDPGMLAADGLHYSALAYASWAKEISTLILNQVP